MIEIKLRAGQFSGRDLGQSISPHSSSVIGIREWTRSLAPAGSITIQWNSRKF